MRRVYGAAIIACIALILGLAHSDALAKGRAKAKGLSGSYHGIIIEVSTTTVDINVGVDREHRILVGIGKSTAVTSGGKKGTIADLARGQIVDAQVANNKAKSIKIVGLVNTGG